MFLERLVLLQHAGTVVRDLAGRAGSGEVVCLLRRRVYHMLVGHHVLV